jgi:hypothetical protein
MEALDPATTIATAEATTTVATVVGETTTVTADPTVAPKRGGLHPTYGMFIGGAKLTDEYKLADVTSVSYFRFYSETSQEGDCHHQTQSA